MLDREQLVELFDRLGTPKAGRELIIKARVRAPVRQVKSRGGNVITLLASRKMGGREIRTESRHIEFAAAVDHEYNPAVSEYYAQPCELKLELVDYQTGEIRQIHHYPDFLTISEDGFTLEEWKSEAKLTTLAAKYPHRYEKGSDGLWRSPQIEKQLAGLGIRYRIHSEESVPRRRVENYLHLEDYLRPGAEPCDETELSRLHTVLQQHGSIYLNELLATPYGFTADFLLQAVADQKAIADLDHEFLGTPRQARLYRDEVLRDFIAGETSSRGMPGMSDFVLDIVEGLRFTYDSKVAEVVLVSEKKIVISVEGNDKQISLSQDWLLQAHANREICVLSGPEDKSADLARYSEEQLRIALQRKNILDSGDAYGLVSNRTMRRWAAKQMAAVANGANEVLALVPQTSAKGNRQPRLSEDQQSIMQRVINERWKSNEAINYKACYRWLLDACNEAGVKAPSYPTLIASVKAGETKYDVRTRHGKRMAYQQGEFIDVLYADTPVHGSRPFQYVHIDHTQLDIELVSSRTGKPLGRPWLSFAVDAWSRRIVAMYLTFDCPSYESVMMVMRDMVRRHNRLPEFIVVDNGRDFMSSAFEGFLLAMGVHLRFRPAGQPRHGAVLERVFGRVHSEYVHNLAGNTKATKNVRMTTGKHMPVNFAEWTLETMHAGLEYWAFQYYEHTRHPALDCSPWEAYQRGLKESGTRAQRRIQFNQDFMIATCPPADREGIRRVDRQRGVKVNGLLYWSKEFQNPKVAGEALPVRRDPWDASSVYVRIKDRWVQAICRNLIGLGQLTDFERRALTQEYIRRSGKGLDEEQANQRLREFMEVFTPEGALIAEMDRHEENKQLYTKFNLAGVAPPTELLKKHSLTKDISSTAFVPSFRPAPLSTSSPLSEATGLDNLPEFDTF